MTMLLASCASWFGSSDSVPDNPAVGGRQDSSDMLFGQTNNMPATGPGESSQPIESIAR